MQLQTYSTSLLYLALFGIYTPVIELISDYDSLDSLSFFSSFSNQYRCSERMSSDIDTVEVGKFP